MALRLAHFSSGPLPPYRRNMKLKKELSKVRFELECTAEEIAQCKPGEYVEDANGTKLYIWSVNPQECKIEVGLTVSQPFSMPRGLGRVPG